MEEHEHHTALHASDVMVLFSVVYEKTKRKLLFNIRVAKISFRVSFDKFNQNAMSAT